MNRRFNCFCCVFLLGPCLTVLSSARASDAPVPGKQVVQEVELPANPNTWDYRKQGIDGIDRSEPPDPGRVETVRYWIYLPLDYDREGKKSAPLLLFLHGAGERGSEPGDIDKVKVHGPPKLLDDAAFQKNWPCVTVSPQCKADYTWSAPQLMLLLDHIEKKYRIDRTRIYVTGISMGGFGTWSCLHENPKRFAAAAPVCGGARPDRAGSYKSIPIWNFHGDKDRAVPIAHSRAIVQAVRDLGNGRMIFTVYEGAGHDVWTRTYGNQLLYDWLFSNALP